MCELLWEQVRTSSHKNCSHNCSQICGAPTTIHTQQGATRTHTPRRQKDEAFLEVVWPSSGKSVISPIGLMYIDMTKTRNVCVCILLSGQEQEGKSFCRHQVCYDKVWYGMVPPPSHTKPDPLLPHPLLHYFHTTRKSR
jgi:hypothetical protein